MASDIEPITKERKHDESPEEAVTIEDFEIKTDEKKAKRKEEGTEIANGIGFQVRKKAKRGKKGTKSRTEQESKKE